MDNTRAKKILFVDDDKFLLDMYALKFNKAGYEVKLADSGEAGLSLLRSGFEPDVILMDMIMPVMDGVDFVNKVHEEKLAPKATLIMLTNQGSSEDISRAQSAGIKGYIVKATTIPSEVLTSVEKICGGNDSAPAPVAG